MAPAAPVAMPCPPPTMSRPAPVVGSNQWKRKDMKMTLSLFKATIPIGFESRPGSRRTRIVADMRASEIRELIRVKPVELDAPRRRVSACHDIADLRATGRRLIPRPVFDYVDGGADEEVSLRANTRAFRQYRFQPRTLVNVSEADTTAAFLGSLTPLPLVLAPTGYTRMMHPAGEIAAARAAQRHGLPYTLSTMATTPIEAVAEAVSSQPTDPDLPPGQPDLWFQLYILRDSGLNKELVDRAAAAKYRVLVVTVGCL